MIQNIGLSIMIYIGGLGRKYKSQSIHVAKIGGRKSEKKRFKAVFNENLLFSDKNLSQGG